MLEIVKETIKSNECSTYEIYHARELGMQLLPTKRPHHVGMVKDPKYCHCHHLIGDPLQTWNVFKWWVSQQLRDGNIVLAAYILKQHRSVQAASCNVITLDFNLGEETHDDGSYQFVDTKGRRPMLPVNERFLNYSV